VLQLNLRQRVRHAPADVLRMAGALKNHAETNNGRWSPRLPDANVAATAGISKARHANDLNLLARPALTPPPPRHHRVHIARAVARSGDGK
jgi:hypothetical protein